MMDIYRQIVINIIAHQEAIIGPIAVEQAQHIPNLSVEWDKHDVVLDGDPSLVIDDLVRAYSRLFGKISVEVSREAAGSLLRQLQPNRLPHSLEV